MLTHSGATTDILCEYYDSSEEPLPQPGNRPYEFYRIEEFDDPQFPDSDTHYRVGDWEVVRVEQYPTAEPGSNYDLIAVCYCQYARDILLNQMSTVWCRRLCSPMKGMQNFLRGTIIYRSYYRKIPATAFYTGENVQPQFL